MVPTPVQSVDFGPAVLEELTRTWHAYTAERGQSRRCGKRRKTDEGKEIPIAGHANDGASPRMRVSPTLRIQEWYERGWEAGVGYCLGVCATRWRKRKERQRKREQQDPDMLAWDDVVASAALRCLCDVRVRLIRVPSSPTPVTLGQSDALGSDEIEELLGVVRDEGTSAELVLEIVRTLLAQVSQTRSFQHAQASVIIKTSIDILIRHCSP
ncbi:hypothetical protein BKA82DRAFT_500168 [Pisolithus tinctorius]|uniref:Uncharacterized protein n=1 Tax=Pisolithus tinctorius Marx 270 TaxID=870435 RepID=A0A0C3JAY2_PISTI|nr:hypothetical protein BKA82DRAFT_500168 [Pisolithus tinctorius]KIO06228.1 hypothetical protein M404DRAFT_500168 [Pisolithus tinctorius Marx 270]